MIASLPIGLYLLTLGIFIEAQVDSSVKRRVGDSVFQGGNGEVAVTAFVFAPDREIFGIPFFLQLDAPVKPYSVGIVTSVIAGAEPTAEFKANKVRIVSADGLVSHFVEEDFERIGNLSARKLDGRHVVGRNIEIADAVTAAGDFTIEVQGSFGGDLLIERCQLRIAHNLAVYPGWFKLLYLDQF